jgi:hypothetical protein
MRRILIWSVFVTQFAVGQEPRRSPETSNGQRTETMPDDALVSAYPGKRIELEFECGSFSPDGMLFAVAVSNIHTGDPEQAWIYDLRSSRVVRVTQAMPDDSPNVISIKDILWSDDGTLYVSALRIRGIAHPYFVAATLNSASVIGSLPATMADAFRQHDPNTSCYGLREEHSDRYSVTVKNRGHGDIVLESHSRRGGKPRQITRASWELESFLFTKARSEVLYPSADSVVAFNLRTGKYRAVLRGTGPDLRLLGRTIDGKLIAYTVRGPCVSNRDNRFSIRQPRNVCFSRVE